MQIGPLVGDFTPSPTGSREIVFILHGLGGHRDYCYQKILAKQLTELGYNTFRFDFRSCGDSDDVPDPQTMGRSIHGTDYEDLNSVYQHFVLERQFKLECIVGHSRGVACMFVWQIRNPDIFVPFYVNCSGRYDCRQVIDRVGRFPGFWDNKGYTSVAKRHGKKQKLWYPLEETMEYSRCDSLPYASIDSRTQVLTVFGILDHIVPARASGQWANLFGSRGTLEVIMNADHNFYGTVDGKHVNYNPIVSDTICKWLTPKAQLRRWCDANAYITQPRWVHVQGVENLRDFGGYGSVRSGVLFRSAALNRITKEGEKQLKQLGITDIFDLRSRAELKRDKTSPLQTDDITTHLTPLFDLEDWSPQALAEHTKSLGSGLSEHYREILEAGIESQAFAKIVRCLAGGGRVLVHCTAGKDRTGIVCAMILLALGVDNYTICREYELTTIGYRSQREKLAAMLSQVLDRQQVEIMLGSSFSTMWETLEWVKSKYGSGLEYFKQAGVQSEYHELRARLLCGQAML